MSKTETLVVNSMGVSALTNGQPIHTAIAVVPSYLMNTSSAGFARESSLLHREALYHLDYVFSGSSIVISKLIAYVGSSFGGSHYVEIITNVTLDLTVISSVNNSLYVDIEFFDNTAPESRDPTLIKLHVVASGDSSPGLRILDFSKSGGQLNSGIVVGLTPKPSESVPVLVGDQGAGTWNTSVRLTGSLQSSDNRRSVVALCSLDNTNILSNSYSSGALSFHRPDSSSLEVFAQLQIAKTHDSESPRGVISILSTSDVPELRFCTFVKGGKKFGGVQFFGGTASFSDVIWVGVGNFEVFGYDYWNTQSSSSIDSEVATSISFTDGDFSNKDSQIDARIASAIDNIAPSQSGTAPDSLKLNGFPSHTSPLANTVARRDSSGDLNARYLRSSATTSGAIPAASAQIMVRNSTTDNYLLPVGRAAFKAFLGVNPAAATGLGYGQTYLDVTSSRARGVTYYNNTGKPILVIVSMNIPGNTGSFVISAYISGVFISLASHKSTGYGSGTTGYLVVPTGSSYRITSVGTLAAINSWTELR